MNDTELKNLDADAVLPLTREWIEIFAVLPVTLTCMFSLLRGSGLKYLTAEAVLTSEIVLPLTREWIEMLSCGGNCCCGAGSPSYEGVD